MGHLINPLSNRLSINSFWNSNWSLTNTFNYNNIFKQDFILFQFLNWFSRKAKFGKFNIIISHYKIFRSFDKLCVNFYYYNAAAEEKKHYLQLNSLIGILKNINYKTSSSYYLNVYRKLGNKKKNNNNIKNNSFKKFFFKKSLLDRKIRSMLDYLIKNLISYLYWFLINKSLKTYISTIEKGKKNILFNVFSLNFLNITSDVISTYISLKLQQKYSLNWILRPVLKDLTTKVRKRLILGFKIVCSGRFTRKQIATYSWNKFGSLNISSFSSLVKYSESSVRLKYGLCGIKVWLNYGSNNLNLFSRNLFLMYPCYSPFKYIINFNNNTIIFFVNYWYYLYLKVSVLKSKSYGLYSSLLKIKIRVFLRHNLRKLLNKVDNYRYSLTIINNNRLLLKLTDNYKNYKDKERQLFFT